MITVFILAIASNIPIDLASLYLTLIQTLLAVVTVINSEEVNEMKNSILVVSGTHGVVHACWDINWYQVPSGFESRPLRYPEVILNG